LPAGEQWVDWFTGKTYKGGWVTAYECLSIASPSL
jgi:hypothetical protein